MSRRIPYAQVPRVSMEMKILHNSFGSMLWSMLARRRFNLTEILDEFTKMSKSNVNFNHFQK